MLKAKEYGGLSFTFSPPFLNERKITMALQTRTINLLGLAPAGPNRAILLFLCGFCILMTGYAHPVQAANVYVLSSGDTNIDAGVQATLEDFGHTVLMGVKASEFHSGAALEGYEAVLFLYNRNYPNRMPNDGQTELQTYVLNGGGLVTGEWLIYSNPSILRGVLPATPSGYNSASPITYSAAQADQTLNAYLPASFQFQADNIGGTETRLQPKAGASVFYQSDNLGVGVIGWEQSAGRVISFSTLIGTAELADANYGQLLSNALSWVAKKPPLEPPAPDYGWALAGTWVATSFGSSTTWLRGPWTLHRQDLEGFLYTSNLRFVTIEPALFGRFPDATAFTEFTGNLIRLDKNLYQGTHLAYGTKKAEGQFAPEVVWMSLLTSTVTIEDPNNLTVDSSMSLYLPTQDKDDDGVPDPDETPMECLEYLGWATWLQVGFRCLPVPGGTGN